MHQKVAFILSDLHIVKPEHWKVDFQFPTAQHLHERSAFQKHYECLGGTKLFLITLNNSHLFAKFARMQK